MYSEPVLTLPPPLTPLYPKPPVGKNPAAAKPHLREAAAGEVQLGEERVQELHDGQVAKRLTAQRVEWWQQL